MLVDIVHEVTYPVIGHLEESGNKKNDDVTPGFPVAVRLQRQEVLQRIVTDPATKHAYNINADTHMLSKHGTNMAGN